MFIVRDESNASLRVVPIWCVGSDGTTPAASEAGGQPQFMIGGVFYGNTSGTLSAWSAAAGQYFVTLTQSEVSILGPAVVRYNSASALETETPLLVVAANSYNSQDLGLDGVNVASFDANAITAAAIATGAIDADAIADNAIDAGAIAANAITAAKIATDAITTDKIAAGTYSDVTFSVGGTAPSLVTIAPGTHSSVTIQGVTTAVNLTTNNDKTDYTIAAGTYSSVTFSAGGTAPSLVTLAPGTHSSATIQGVETATDVTNSVTASVGAGGITAASFGASAIDAAALATDAGQEIADRMLSRSIAGGADSGRTVGEALFALRNRVEVGDSVMTVYQNDDSSSAWTASATTAAFPLGEINPA